jgi:steroid delta-isomerase-like uncharacterized protein
MTSEENEAVARQAIEAVNAFAAGGPWGDVSALNAASYRIHAPGLTLDGEELRAYMTNVNAGFPGNRFTVVDAVSAGDRVALRTTWRSVQSGPYEGLPPSDKQIEIEQFFFMRLEDGKIAEVWTVWDSLGMAVQLGVVPAGQPSEMPQPTATG